MRGEPGNDVRDFLVRHRPAADVAAPIRGSQLGTAADDDGAQSPVADQRQEGIVGYGTTLWSALALGTVARFAIDGVGDFAALRVAIGLRGVGRRIRSVEHSRPAPARPDVLNDR